MITLTPGSRLPLAWRIGWRDMTRDWRRGALVVVLIMIPLALLIGVVIAGTSLQPSLRDEVRVGLGSAAGKLTSVECSAQSLRYASCDYSGATQPVEPATEAELLARVPAGHHSVVERAVFGSFAVDGLSYQGRLVATDAADPLLRGRYDLQSGAWPTGSEVLVNEAVAVRYGVAPGDSVGLGDREYPVSGIVHHHPWAGQDPTPVVVVGPQHPFAAELASVPSDSYGPVVYLDGGLPPVSDYPAWNADGIGVTDRDVLLGLDDPDSVALGTGGGAGVLVLMATAAVMLMAILVAGSAMAIGAQRVRRVLALLSATGARPRMLRTIFAVQGLVLGAVAAVLAIPVAMAGAGVFLAIADHWQWAQVMGFRMQSTWGLAGGATALLAGTLASAVPGFRIGAVDPVRALSEAHRQARLWVALVGIGLVALSAAAVVVVALRVDRLRAARALTDELAFQHSIAVMVAAGVAIPGVLLAIPLALRGVAAVSGRTPLVWRMAGRDLGRSRHRSVPVVASVVAGSLVAGFAVAVAGFTVDQQVVGHQWRARLDEAIVSPPEAYGAKQLDPDAVLGAVAAVVPVTEFHVLLTPGITGSLADGGSSVVNLEVLDRSCRSLSVAVGDCPERMWAYPSIVIGDVDLVPVLAGVPATPAMRDHLASGGALTFSDLVLDSRGNLELSHSVWPRGADTGTEHRLGSLPVMQVAPNGNYGASVLVSAETAERIGLVTAEQPAKPAAWLKLSRTPTEKEQAQIQAAVAALDPQVWVSVEAGPPVGSPIVWATVAISGAVLLLIVVVITTLASGDRRRDDALLSVLGGGPALRRRVAAAQALWLGALGGVMGVLLAAYLTVAFFRVYMGILPSIPEHLAVLIIGVPLLAAGIAWLTTPGRAGLRDALISGRPQAIGGDG